MTSLGKLIERNASLFGSDVAMKFGGSSQTHAERAIRGRKLASALEGLGVRHQDRVSILAMNCPEYIDVYAAGYSAGYLIGTVNFRLSEGEMLYILQDSAPKVLIFEQQYAEIIDRLRTSCPSISHYVCIGDAPEWAIGFNDLLESGSPDGAGSSASSDDLVHLIYSSGTTGRPKGVVKTHAAELARGEIFSGHLQMTQSDRNLIIMPLFHTGATSIVLASLWAGCSFVLHRKFDPVEVLRTIEAERITMIHVAPTLVRALLDSPAIDDFDLSSLRTILYAAAPMPVPLLKRGIAKFGPIFVNGYGSTEGGSTFLLKHFHNPDGTEEEIRRLASVGHPASRVELRIVDESGHEVPTGEAGEITLRSPIMMARYWNNDVATHDALRDGWLHTGDIGRRDEHGFIYLVDRLKDMIITGGENVYCQEVEQVIFNAPGVGDVAVFGLPDEHWGERVTAALVPAAVGTLAESELRAYCETALARYKIPRQFFIVDELPRLQSGKVDKKALKAQFSTQN